MLTEKLTKKQRGEILNDLFGFTFNKNGTLIDDEGGEFYGTYGNCQFDFSTLAGIFSYTAHRAKNQGYEEAKHEIRKALGFRI
jgi:hypothetical protein